MKETIRRYLTDIGYDLSKEVEPKIESGLTLDSEVSVGIVVTEKYCIPYSRKEAVSLHIQIVDDDWIGSPWLTLFLEWGQQKTKVTEYLPVRKEYRLYGYVNSKIVFTRDEFVFRARGFGPIETDEELMAFAEKVSGHWHNAGWSRKFTEFYLSDYACGEPYQHLTNKEFYRLKELQKQAQAAEKAADDAREWKKVDHICYADNSEEEIWEDKDGIRKTVMVVGPHGDACY